MIRCKVSSLNDISSSKYQLFILLSPVAVILLGQLANDLVNDPEETRL
jgi:hypothetical protein